MEEERIVGLHGFFDDLERGGIGDAVAGADDEVAVGAGAIALVPQFSVQCPQVLLQVVFEGGDGVVLALAAPPRLAIGPVEVLETVDLGVEVLERFGHGILDAGYWVLDTGYWILF